MRIFLRTLKGLTGQRGQVLPLVAILMFVLLGFAAFAIDLGSLYVVKNELQNAADAGALAGAAQLFDANGNLQGDLAASTAQAASVLNKSGGNPVPTPTVDIGNYQFASSTSSPGVFTPNNSGQQLAGWQNISFSGLNGNPNFINAVRVTISRTDAPSFFSQIFGYSQFGASAQAVAYVGFAGTFPIGTFQEPIAICQQSIADLSGNYTWCSGSNPPLMLNNGKFNSQGTPIGEWTNFTQPCLTADDSSVGPLICASGNPSGIVAGQAVGTEATTATPGGNFDTFSTKCWLGSPLSLTLPVIDCSISTSCPPVVGAVYAQVIWVNRDVGTASYPQTYTVYLLPVCAGQPPPLPMNRKIGGGGQNFGILAQYPVLVK